MATSELEFLESYDPTIYERPSASVDTVIFTVIDGALQVLLVQRSEHPFRERWSLVGGYIDLKKDQDLLATAKRKLHEKTGVKTPYLEQCFTVGNKDRDPRGWTLTTVYFALIPHGAEKLRPGRGALDIKWSKVSQGKVNEKLAFDHAQLLAMCYERLKGKVFYTSLPVHLMPKEFTLRDLQNIYEIILDYPLDHKSFRRRILNTEILEPTGATRHESKRPAQLFRMKRSAATHFFSRNIEGPLRNE
jgi:8-oxo-dGTP diphosphatase